MTLLKNQALQHAPTLYPAQFRQLNGGRRGFQLCLGRSFRRELLHTAAASRAFCGHALGRARGGTGGSAVEWMTRVELGGDGWSWYSSWWKNPKQPRRTGKERWRGPLEGVLVSIGYTLAHRHVKRKPACHARRTYRQRPCHPLPCW